MVVGWCSQWWDIVDQEGIWGTVGLERRLRGVGDIVVQEKLRCCWSGEEVKGSRSVKLKMRCCWSEEEVKGRRSVKSKIRHCWSGENAVLPVWRGAQREEEGVVEHGTLLIRSGHEALLVMRGAWREEVVDESKILPIGRLRGVTVLERSLKEWGCIQRLDIIDFRWDVAGPEASLTGGGSG